MSFNPHCHIYYFVFCFSSDLPSKVSLIFDIITIISSIFSLIFDLTVWPFTHIAVLNCLPSSHYTSSQMSSQLHTLFWSYAYPIIFWAKFSIVGMFFFLPFTSFQRSTLDIYGLILLSVWYLNNFDTRISNVPHIIPEVPFWFYLIIRLIFKQFWHHDLHCTSYNSWGTFDPWKAFPPTLVPPNLICSFFLVNIDTELYLISWKVLSSNV